MRHFHWELSQKHIFLQNEEIIMTSLEKETGFLDKDYLNVHS